MHSNKDIKELSEEEYCHYSGLPSVKFYENVEKETMQKKESKTNLHFTASIIKSAVRVMAGITLINDQIVFAGCLLIFAELFGIIEEL